MANPRAERELERREEARRAERRSKAVFAEVAHKMIVKKCKLPRPKVSRLEEEFQLQLATFTNRPIYTREWQFMGKQRRWRFDFAWPSSMVAVELEGGTWSGGRHVRGSGFEKDCEKYNEAILRGWRVGRFTAKMVKSGAAIEWLRQVFA